MNEFKKYCSEERDGIPFNIDDCFRFLQAKAFDNKTTYDAIITRNELFKSFFPSTLTEKCQQMLYNGYLTVSGHDKCNRPILVTQPKIMFDANPTA